MGVVMHTYIEILATLPGLVICYQLYAFAANSQGMQRQRRFQKLGIAFMAIGITSLVAREPVFVFMGLMLIMAGFRLMAKGLDRLEKNIYIDRYDGDNKGAKPEKEG
jgi:hypothetical protein